MVGIYKSPIGDILMESDGDYLTGLHFVDASNLVIDADMVQQDEVSCEILSQCRQQLQEYFDGTRKIFELKIKPEGTVFRKLVWEQLCKIPFGKTASYKEIAVEIGNEKAVRAVGGANHHNKISIIVPCHRVIGADGSLTGYGGEIWRKEWLLTHERNYL